MTRVEFVMWLEAHDCEQEPIEGINHTGRQIKYTNHKTRRYTYVDLPIDEREIPDYVVLHACKSLWIDHPNCVSHEEERFNKIRTDHNIRDDRR